MSFIIRLNVLGALHGPNGMATHSISPSTCLKRYLADVLVVYSNLPRAKGEVEMGVKVRVLQLVEGLIYAWKWVSVLTRNLIKATVVNAQLKRAIGFTRKQKCDPKSR
jgi:hypothetical protein